MKNLVDSLSVHNRLLVDVVLNSRRVEGFVVEKSIMVDMFFLCMILECKGLKNYSK